MTSTRVQISQRVWEEWRLRADEESEWSLHLLVACDDPNRTCERAVGQSLLGLQDRLAAQAEASGEPDPPFPGEWAWVGVAGGVLVQVVECDVFPEMLNGLAAELDHEGLGGTIELWARPEGVRPPRNEHMLACRVRIRGGARPNALLSVLDRWCRAPGAGATYSLTCGTLGPIAIEPDEDVLDRIVAAVRHDWPTSFVSVADDEFRGYGVHSATRCSFIVGGQSVARGAWRPALSQLTSQLSAAASCVEYAFVMRGWTVEQTLQRGSLSLDWPVRPEETDRLPLARSGPACAPDAFGIQLLGPNFAARLPRGPQWRASPLPGDAVLLEHVDPEAWFAAPFVPFGERKPPEEREAPAALVQARVDLAPLLCP